MIAIGGLVEITPLFYLKSTIEMVDGVRPYTPLELAGRNIYVREGCYLCHSQMIRPLRDEVERYGHYSLAAESMYDHPFQWGSKRTGPDLARVGGKYSDDWHVTHLNNPRAIVPQSVMPGYPFLAKTEVDIDASPIICAPAARSACPTRDDQIANAAADLKAQADPDNAGTRCVRQALPEGGRPQLRRQAGHSDRDGRAGRLSADARHAGRLQALQRKSQSSLRRHRTMKAILTVQNIGVGLRHVVLDADLRRRSFIAIVAYALWPRNKAAFDEAAKMPLRED